MSGWFTELAALVDDVEALAGVDVPETVRVDADRLAQFRAELVELQAATPPADASRVDAALWSAGRDRAVRQLRADVKRETDAQPRLLTRHADALVGLLQPGHQLAAVEVAGILTDDPDLWHVGAERAIDLDPRRLQAWRRLRDLRQHLDQIEAIGEHCRGDNKATVAVDGQPATRVGIALGDEALWDWSNVDDATTVRLVSAIQSARLFASLRHRAPRWPDMVAAGALRTLPTRGEAVSAQVALENMISEHSVTADLYRRPHRRLTAA